MTNIYLITMLIMTVWNLVLFTKYQNALLKIELLKLETELLETKLLFEKEYRKELD